MEKIPLLFGAEIRRRREKTGVSQEAFASLADVHRTYISAIELGKVSVSIEVAAKLAEALETPLSRIWRDIEKKMGENAAE